MRIPYICLTLTVTVPSLFLPASAASSTPFDLAFRFAKAIVSDEKDRTAAEEQVVVDMASSGALDEAQVMAREVEGWHRARACARVASELILAGRADDGRKMLALAEALHPSVKGWQGGDVSAEIARAHALLGDIERSRAISTDLATNDNRFEGVGAATIATAQAVSGDIDAALATLAPLDESLDYETAFSRTAGYLEVARNVRTDPEKHEQILLDATASAEKISGWLSAKSLVDAGRAWHDAGDDARARATLVKAEQVARDLPNTTPVKVGLLVMVANAWIDVGDKKHARALLEQAEGVVPDTLLTRRPEGYGEIAAAHYEAGGGEKAARVLDKALSEAAALVNSRPRALEMAAICRSLGRRGVVIDSATRARIGAILESLGDPW